MKTKEIFSTKASYTFFAAGFAAFTIVLLFAASLFTAGDTDEPTKNNPSASGSNTPGNDSENDPDGSDDSNNPGDDPTDTPTDGEDLTQEEKAVQQERSDLLVVTFGADPERIPPVINAGDRFPIYTNQGEYTCSFNDSTPECSDSEGDYERDPSIPLIYGAAGYSDSENYPDDPDER